MVEYQLEDVLHFWFVELTNKDWFSSNQELDALIKKRFKEILSKAKAGELYSWRTSIRGRLAEIIVLDQFSRNIYRNNARAFSSDDMALTLAQEALKTGEVKFLTKQEVSFLYMPFMHSESLLIQEKFSMNLFAEEGLEKRYKYAKEHYETIKKFGRFPYRNNVLNRTSTSQEIEYLREN